MPIYDFKCQVCNKEFEMILKMDEDIARYPGCENGDCSVKKVISTSSFHLKGAGWYKTDYGKSNSNRDQ
jgi:putative FmdB family regulatory protein